eukprot:gene10547-12317_t
MSVDGNTLSIMSSAMHDMLATDNSSDRSSRQRKPTARYVEQTSYEVLRQLYHTNEKTGKKRGRKPLGERTITTPESAIGKWRAYRLKVSTLARSIARDLHAMTSYEVEDGNFTATRSVIPKEELIKCTDRIRKAKVAILEQFSAMDAEYSDHTRWPQLKTGYDEEDDVSVDDIMCSLCNLPDEDNNDILFCDHVGCLRAYHQKCLDPPQLTEPDADADWFCRQCECMDDCLDLVGEILGHDTEDYHELFPELRAGAEGIEGQGVAEDDDSEEDGDYDPSDSEEQDDESAAGSGEEESAEGGTSVGDGGLPGKGSRSKRRDKNHRRAEDEASQAGSDNSSSSDDDSEGSDSDIESASDSGGDIEEDELQGLLRDAAEDDIFLLETISAGHSAACEGEEAPRRSLRARRAVDYTLAEDKSKVPEGVADVGKKVAAMVRKGVLGVGEIVSFRYAEPGWVEIKDKSAWKKVDIDSESEAEVDNPGGDQSEENEIGAHNDSSGDGVDADDDNPTEVPASANANKTIATIVTSETDHSLVSTESASVSHNHVVDSAEPALYWSGQEPEPQAPEPVEQTLENGVWTAHFETAGVEREFGLETLKEFFALYAECAEKLEEDAQKSNDKSRSVESTVAEQGRLDTANVLTHKRMRVRLDYAALSKEMFGDKADSDSDDSSVQDAEVVQEVLHDMHQAQQLEQHLALMRAQDEKKRVDKTGRRRKSPAGSDDGSVVSVGTAVSSATSTAVDSVRYTSSRNDNDGEEDEGPSTKDAQEKKREKLRAYQAAYRAKKRLEKTGDTGAEPKRRGRPRKDSHSPFPSAVSGSEVSPGSLMASGKKRGRPRKDSLSPLPCKDKDQRYLEPGTGSSSGRDEPVSNSACAPHPPADVGTPPFGAAVQELLRLFPGARQQNTLPLDAPAHHLLSPGTFSESHTSDAYWPNSLQNSPRSASADVSNPGSETKKRGRPKGSKNKEKAENDGSEKKPRTKKAKLQPVGMPNTAEHSGISVNTVSLDMEVEEDCIH